MRCFHGCTTFLSKPSAAASVVSKHQVGELLHQEVPACNWCITKDDLDYFEQKVRASWVAGQILSDDPVPDPRYDDPTVGPSMHSVNKYFIKPETSQAGGMSWALMRNPKGHPCDIFATHCWDEGVFEFTRKVRVGFKHGNFMYVCFLSNPQNLDINALVSVPLEKTPFAQALKSAHTLLVIPTFKTGIYTRLWCVYEANLAITWGKQIIMSPGTLWDGLRRCSVYVQFVAVFGAVLGQRLGGMVCDVLDFAELLRFLIVGYRSLFEGGALRADGPELRPLSSSPAWVAYGVVPAMSSVVGWGAHLFRLATILSAIDPSVVVNATTPAMVGLLWHCLARSLCAEIIEDIFDTRHPFHILEVAASVLVLSACREIWRESVRLAAQLQLDFTSVKDATCRHKHDTDRIRQEIAGMEDEIDESVRLLAAAGMSNARLRSLRHRGVAVQNDSLCFAIGALLWASETTMWAVASASKEFFIHSRMVPMFVAGDLLAGILAIGISSVAYRQAETDCKQRIERLIFTSGLLVVLFPIIEGICAGMAIFFRFWIGITGSGLLAIFFRFWIHPLTMAMVQAMWIVLRFWRQPAGNTQSTLANCLERLETRLITPQALRNVGAQGLQRLIEGAARYGRRADVAYQRRNIPTRSIAGWVKVFKKRWPVITACGLCIVILLPVAWHWIRFVDYIFFTLSAWQWFVLFLILPLAAVCTSASNA